MAITALTLITSSSFILFFFLSSSSSSSSFFASLQVFLTAEAAHARKRPTTLSSSYLSSSRNKNNNLKYDRQITTFDPNGKLLQVEYANECSKRGQSCAFVNYKDDIIVAVMKRRQRTANDSEGNNDEKKMTTTSRASSTNTGITAGTTTGTGIHRISDAILCKMTGLEGDGRLLARHLQSVAHQLAWTDGILSSSSTIASLSSSSSSSSSSSTVVPHYMPPVVFTNQIAKVCGQVQHSLTIRNGARPLGVDAVFMGRTFNSITNNNKLGLFHCTVGGTVNECHFCATGKDSHFILRKLHHLYQSLHDNNENDDDDDCHGRTQDVLKHLIQQVSNIVMYPDQNESNYDGNNSDHPIDNLTKDQIDIYVIMGNPKCRGGIQISCALSVLEKDVENVTELFHKEYSFIEK